ncbi:MAG: hypothetical protein ACREPE_05665 [Lysobacter sp.]
MNTQNKQPGAGGPGQEGQASGKHQGLRHPDDDQRVKQALDEVDLADQGESAEDELRDRRGRGLPNTNDVRSDSNDDERNERR